MVGGTILLVVACLVISLLMFWREIPGLLGETVGKVVGIMSTPFFMETSFEEVFGPAEERGVW